MSDNEPVGTAPWPKKIFAVTLFTDNLQVSKKFYHEVFDLPVEFEGPTSAVFDFGNVIINLLVNSSVDEFISPVKASNSSAGIRQVITVNVDDVDAVCHRLKAQGVKILAGPMDRPWGPRTANFADPSGHLWEISS